MILLTRSDFGLDDIQIFFARGFAGAGVRQRVNEDLYACQGIADLMGNAAESLPRAANFPPGKAAFGWPPFSRGRFYPLAELLIKAFQLFVHQGIFQCQGSLMAKIIKDWSFLSVIRVSLIRLSRQYPPGPFSARGGAPRPRI